MQNDSKLLTDFQRVAHSNDKFKNDVCTELDYLCYLMTQHKNTSSISPTTNPTLSTFLPVASNSSNVSNSQVS
jgi:hypothetical protein